MFIHILVRRFILKGCVLNSPLSMNLNCFLLKIKYYSTVKTFFMTLDSLRMSHLHFSALESDKQNHFLFLSFRLRVFAFVIAVQLIILTRPPVRRSLTNPDMSLTPLEINVGRGRGFSLLLR